ncbi:MAG: hypothetical protein H3C57_06320 [Gammaproteobacteria bacterium]|nr:hypothetical protein [Gammaproteobacteria bacterium]
MQVRACLLGLLLALALPSGAGPREQAKRIHDRLAGVPPTAATLDAMAADIADGRVIQAAYTAMESPAFYNVTLKNFVAPWTNKERTAFVPLNDYTATVIGMVRDDIPFNTVLSADILYVGGPGLGLPVYAMNSNAHYEAMDERGTDLKSGLVKTTQSAASDLPPQGIAGVLSTRAAAEAFFKAGTNRAMLSYTVENYLCKDLGELKDPSLPVDRIPQDVSRSPGGDSRIYLNACSGCHTGVDPLNQAFAYYNWDEAAARIAYTAGQVQPKYLINADNFRAGYVTRDDQWENYWRRGQNRILGWAGSGAGSAGSGHGAASLGAEFANSEAFAQCQVKKVFRNVCLRDPVDGADRSQVDDMAGSFRSNGYQLKRVFAEAAAYCKGD